MPTRQAGDSGHAESHPRENRCSCIAFFFAPTSYVVRYSYRILQVWEQKKGEGGGRGKGSGRPKSAKMDDYAREMMDLKTLVTRTLEKKGVLAKIRTELRASVFEAIEEEDKVIQNEDNVPPALLGSCNDRAKQLHNSPSGRLLTALICEYLDWAQLGHTLKVYLPECNLLYSKLLNPFRFALVAVASQVIYQVLFLASTVVMELLSSDPEYMCNLARPDAN
ncbi:hypothetical protein Cni_G13095 [Canna indica]|uniref:LisH domain-containing protein n=1 Tax=Canna indica TaxID=4628 RepID=A0AAQ3K9B0_9LILI|nr:hypothetical protein Cni_G13095 [Canna indica]